MPQPLALAFSREHIRPGDRIAVAVSGGADSVALLLAIYLANQAKHDALGVGLSAVHVNHSLRAAESDGDEQFVRELCVRLDVPLHLHRADVADRVAQRGETVEESARNLRYECFHTLLGGGQADTILTAHTLDDQAETVLMKLLRGAWTEGLSAIHPVLTAGAGQVGRAGKIVRPLLRVSRAEITAYLRSVDQPWREDSSNSDEIFTRNRVRHQILPLLRAENPSLDLTLSSVAELAREDEAYWQAEVARILPQLLLPGRPVRGGGRAVSTAPGEAHASLAIEIERLRVLEPALRGRVLRAAARRLGVRLGFDETARLLALCGFRAIATVSSKPGSTLRLSQQLVAERSARELRLSRAAGVVDAPNI